MAADEKYTLLIEVRSDVNKAVSGLGKVEKTTKQAAGRFSTLRDSAKTAAGMLMRDFVRSASASLKESMQLGATVQTLTVSFDRLVEATGGETLSLEGLREATQGMVSDVDLLSSANQWMMLGLPTDDFDDLSAAAIKLGAAMGIDAQFAVDSLTKGLGRQSRMILDNLGVVVDTETAYANFAEEVGIAASALTEEQKKEAWIAEALDMIKEKAEDLGDVMSGQQVAQQQFVTWIDNVKAAAGRALGDLGLGGLGTVLGEYGGIITPLAYTLLPDLAKALRDNIAAAGGLGPALKTSLAALGAVALPAAAAVLPALGVGYAMKEMGFRPTPHWAELWTEQYGGGGGTTINVDVHDNQVGTDEELAEEIGKEAVDWLRVYETGAP